MSVVSQNIQQFRRRLRELHDKKRVSKRELQGLFWDVYELFVVMHEETADPFGAMMPPPSLFKVDKDTFDEVVKLDKEKKAKAGEPVDFKHRGEGQYL